MGRTETAIQVDGRFANGPTVGKVVVGKFERMT